MSTAAIIAIAIGVVLVLGAISSSPSLVAATSVAPVRSRARPCSRDKSAAARSAEPRGGRARPSGVLTSRPQAVASRSPTHRGRGASTRPSVVPWTPPDPEAIGVSRRQFFNRATVTLMSAGLGALRSGSVRRRSSGRAVPAASAARSPSASSATSKTASSRAAGSSTHPRPVPGSPTTRPRRCRSRRTVYPAAVLSAMEQGIVILSQKCPHLGCRVPECATSQWFECQCHGSQYNRVGEKKAGPAPRGMDHFPATIAASGDVTIDTGTVVPGCRDRHQHHRPGGRRPALHRWRRALMVATATVPRPPSRVIGVRHHHRRVRRLRGCSTSSAGDARSARRSNSPPTARSTTTTRPSRVRASSACSCSACHAPARHRDRPAAVLGARAQPPGRCAGGLGQALRDAGAAELFAPTAEGGFNCAGCHGGMNAVGGEAPFTVTDPVTGEVQARQLEGAGAQHGASTGSTRSEVEFILNYGRPFSPMSPWGTRRRWPDDHPADRQRSSRTSRASRSRVRVASRRTGRRRALRRQLCGSGAACRADEQADIEAAAEQAMEAEGITLRRGPVQPRTRAAAPTAAHAATPSGGATAIPACPARAPIGWNLTGGSANSHFADDEQTWSTSSRTARSSASCTGSTARAADACPGFGSVLTDEQIRAVVEYVRSL